MVVQLSLILVAVWAVFLLPTLWANRRYSALHTTREFSNFTQDLDRAVNRSGTEAGGGDLTAGGAPVTREKVLARRRLVMGILVLSATAGVLAFLLFRSVGVFLVSLPVHLALIGYVSALRRLKLRRLETAAAAPITGPSLMRPDAYEANNLPSADPAPAVKAVL